MKNNKVIIVIRKGFIEEIYSDIENLIFDVIDLDTDDPEREEEFNLELSKVKEAYENEKLFKH